MANRLIKLRPVSAATSTPDAGDGAAQMVVLPVTGLTYGAGVAVDRNENIFVTDHDQHVIYRYRRGTASHIFAGAYGVSGLVDGAGPDARFNTPTAICVDKSGRLWVVDMGNLRIRRVDDNARVFTVAAIPAGETITGIAVDDSENIFLIART